MRTFPYQSHSTAQDDDEGEQVDIGSSWAIWVFQSFLCSWAYYCDTSRSKNTSNFFLSFFLSPPLCCCAGMSAGGWLADTQARPLQLE